MLINGAVDGIVKAARSAPSPLTNPDGEAAADSSDGPRP
jgi:hypothetical protein